MFRAAVLAAREAVGLEGRQVELRPALRDPLRHLLAHRRAEGETVATEAGRDKQVLRFRACPGF